MSRCCGVQSIIRVLFHERRLQYMEREQLDIWRQTRPGERIIDIGLTSVVFLVVPFCLNPLSGSRSLKTASSAATVDYVSPHKA